MAYVGIGSNLGDREATLHQAVELLGQQPGVRVAAVSSLRDTAPVDLVDQPRFLNGACRLETDLSPAELLASLHRVEAALGRDREGETRYGPRTCDLDLLLYGREMVTEPDLVVPHPRLAERRFALEPLVELDADLALPDGRLVAEILAELE
jgi:2-amino-4-hydroxy-6-hydroxymethyldihydropteridine diphosphokinase